MPNRLSSNRSKRTAHRALNCCRCTAPIPAGEVYVHDHARPVHLDCLELYVRPVVTNRTGGEPPRFRTDPHEGRACPGCGTTLAADDDVVHVLAQPWHRDCRRGWRR